MIRTERKIGASMKRIKVTPDLAKEWIGAQACNRTRSRNRVGYYKRIIENGKWICHPSLALHFNEREQLADGQHRLQAVIESGIASDFYIDTLPDEILEAMHDIKHRSLADRLIMGHGFQGADAKMIASIGNAIACRMETGKIDVLDRIGFAMRSYSTEEIMEAFDWTDAEPRELVLTVRRFYEQQPSKFRLLNPTLIGLVACQRPVGWQEFLGELCMDEHPNRRESVVALRRALGNHEYSPTTRMAMIAVAFNNPDAKRIKIGTTIEDLSTGTWIGR